MNLVLLESADARVFRAALLYFLALPRICAASLSASMQAQSVYSRRLENFTLLFSAKKRIGLPLAP